MIPTANKRQTILIIDDNITNLKVAMEHLKAYSFGIVTAREGTAGIERAQLVRPDLILLDVQMPGIDGFETCRRLKSNPDTASIPVIVMTVLSETACKVRGLEAGAVDYVTKPIEEAELLARVTTHLRFRALQEQLQRANEGLEERVRERTASLEAEIARRTQYQEEKEGLLELVRQQSEQLRQLTQLVLETQEAQQGKLHITNQQIDRDVTLLESQLRHAQHVLAEHGIRPHTAGLLAQALEGALDVVQHVRQQSLQLRTDLDQASSAQLNVRTSPLLKLSDREYEIFQLLAQGKSNTEICEMLYLAKTTVSTYRQRIMEKLGMTSLSELINFASQQHLVSSKYEPRL
jgi:DNA-binding NarL/FixJ family response regulator